MFVSFRMVLCESSKLLFMSCLCSVMRNLDAIIHVCVVLCETSMLLFMSCLCSVMRNLDAIIHVCVVLCETSMLLFGFRIMSESSESLTYGLARVIN